MTSVSPNDLAGVTMSSEDALVLLRTGEIHEQGMIPWSSNYAFLITLHRDGQEMLAIYKPRRGERPLWDFPHGTLYKREVAAYILSDALGWHLVPPTVMRNGPFGPGSLQMYIDSDPELHYFNVFPQHVESYRRIALFDVVANNADRKAGHCLLDAAGKIWSIDHGICFHTEPKLRTVIWEFAGQRIPEDELAALEALGVSLRQHQTFASPFRKLLSDVEIEAMCHRLDRLVREGHLPEPDPDRRNFPWPPI